MLRESQEEIKDFEEPWKSVAERLLRVNPDADEDEVAKKAKRAVKVLS